MSAPTITVSAATDLQDQSAILIGDITSTGGKPVTDCGFYCDTNESPARQYHAMVVQDGPFGYKMIGLLPGTTYYFKAFATNEDGYSTSGILSFTTTGTSRGQVLVWAADGGEEEYDFTSEIADIGSIHLEFEENTGEFSSGDCSFSVQNDGAALYGLILSGRQFKVQITVNVDHLFRGDLQVENTGWDPDKLCYTFYALQETKGFMDQASSTPIQPAYGALATLPTDPNPGQSVDAVSDIVTSSLAAFPGPAIGQLNYQPAIDPADTPGNIANKTIGHTVHWYRPDGSDTWGNIGFFAEDYSYSLRDFLLDVCTEWGGAYWVDNEGNLQIRQRNTARQTLSGLDGHISGFKPKLRKPWYDLVAVHRSAFLELYYPDFVLVAKSPWVLYASDDTFIYPFPAPVKASGTEEYYGEEFNVAENEYWDSFSSMGGAEIYNPTSRYSATVLFRKSATYSPSGDNYTMSNIPYTAFEGISSPCAPPVGSALDVSLPSKYSCVSHEVGDARCKPIFFPAINTAAVIRSRFKPMVTPIEQATIEFDEIVHVEPFWGVTAYGDVYLAHTIDYDLPNRKTTVVGNKVVS